MKHLNYNLKFLKNFIPIKMTENCKAKSQFGCDSLCLTTISYVLLLSFWAKEGIEQRSFLLALWSFSLKMLPFYKFMFVLRSLAKKNVCFKVLTNLDGVRRSKSTTWLLNSLPHPSIYIEFFLLSHRLFCFFSKD